MLVSEFQSLGFGFSTCVYVLLAVQNVATSQRLLQNRLDNGIRARVGLVLHICKGEV